MKVMGGGERRNTDTERPTEKKMKRNEKKETKTRLNRQSYYHNSAKPQVRHRTEQGNE